MKIPWFIHYYFRSLLRTVSCVLGTVFFLLTLTACTLTLDLNVGTNDRPDDSEYSLPDPSNVDDQPTNEQPTLDDDQQVRQSAAHKYTADVVYHGGTIVATFQLPSGDIVDFIDRDTLPALSFGLPQVPWTAADLVPPAGVDFGVPEFDQIPEMLDLAATATPFVRPNFWPYILGETDAVSIEDYLERYQEGGAPSGTERLHAAHVHIAPNRGITGFMNQFRPEVEPKSFSLMEFAVACPAVGPAQELVGVVISVDKLNPFGTNYHALTDGEPRMHVEYAVTDPATGKARYRWDDMGGKFVPNLFRVRHPGERVPVSVIGGTQIEHLATIFQAPNGDWWIGFDGDLLGYYPASLFSKSLLGDKGCSADWYGEVAWRRPAGATGWAKTEMGSGKFPAEGIPNVAYVRNPRYYGEWWTTVDATEPSSVASATQKTCYTRNPLTNGILTLGGPGGKDPGCTWP